MFGSSTKTRVATVALAGALATTLSLGLAPHVAWAESLEQLEEAAIKASDKYQAAQDKLDDLNKKIEDNNKKVGDLEAQLPELREKCNVAIKSSYKMQRGQSSLLSLILSADDFNEFVTMLSYMDAVNSANVDGIERLAEAEADLKNTQQALKADKAKVTEETQNAKAAYDDAQATASAARQKAQQDAARRKAAYEAEQAKRKAEAAKKDETMMDDSVAGGNASNNSGSNQSQTTVTEPVPAKPSSKPAGSFKYVLASTYGEGDGFMWGTTASGDTVTPTSMGVAMRTVPLGATIEISYHGKTVTAVVNDRGPFVGDRQFDLQPAVARALGFDGVDTVGYRII